MFRCCGKVALAGAVCVAGLGSQAHGELQEPLVCDDGFCSCEL